MITDWLALAERLRFSGRKEVLTGKAKFGIFGDGKEVAQLGLGPPVRRR